MGPAFTIDEALQAIEGRKPDLALVNLVLQGGEDGAVLALELLTKHGTPTLSVSEDIQAARAR